MPGFCCKMNKNTCAKIANTKLLKAVHGCGWTEPDHSCHKPSLMNTNSYFIPKTKTKTKNHHINLFYVSYIIIKPITTLIALLSVSCSQQNYYNIINTSSLQITKADHHSLFLLRFRYKNKKGPKVP